MTPANNDATREALAELRRLRRCLSIQSLMIIALLFLALIPVIIVAFR